MNSLDKILNLVKKTGDKMIVTDQFGDHDFVVMPLSEYEKIVAGQNNIKDLSEQELLDQVERDISLWRASHEDEDYDDISRPASDWEPPTSFDPAQDFQPFDKAQGLRPEPWEIEPFDEAQGLRPELRKEPWERKPLPFSAQGEPASGWEDKEPMPWEESEEEKIEDEADEHFVLPKYDWDKYEDEDDEDKDKGIKYEDIPPSLDVNIEDIMDKPEKDKIIDMSFEEDEGDVTEGESEDDDFMTEPM